MIQEKEKLSKLDGNSYPSLEIQKYLTDKNLSLRQKKILFKLKCRMSKVGHNYGQKILCRLCKLHNDNQEEMLNCVILKIKCKELYHVKDEKYDDVFSRDINKLSKIAKLFQKCFEIREEILQEQQS